MVAVVDFHSDVNIIVAPEAKRECGTPMQGFFSLIHAVLHLPLFAGIRTRSRRRIVFAKLRTNEHRILTGSTCIGLACVVAIVYLRETGCGGAPSYGDSSIGILY